MALKNINWPEPPGDREINRFGQHRDGGKSKWRTIVGLLIVYVAAVVNWQWIWGVFSLYWITLDFFTGVTYFIEPVYRENNPILYWVILMTWVAFSVVMFFPSAYMMSGAN